MPKSTWSRDDDAQLIKEVEKEMSGERMPRDGWARVAARTGRTVESAKDRWYVELSGRFSQRDIGAQTFSKPALEALKTAYDANNQPNHEERKEILQTINGPSAPQVYTDSQVYRWFAKKRMQDKPTQDDMRAMIDAVNEDEEDASEHIAKEHEGVLLRLSATNGYTGVSRKARSPSYLAQIKSGGISTQRYFTLAVDAALWVTLKMAERDGELTPKNAVLLEEVEARRVTLGGAKSAAKKENAPKKQKVA